MKSLKPTTMKKQIITMLFVALTAVMTAQKLKVNKVDDMTGKVIKETNLVWIKAGMSQAAGLLARRDDNDRQIVFIYERSQPFGISKTPFIFKLDNDSLLEVPVLSSEVASKGGSGRPMGGAYGVRIFLHLTDQQYKILCEKGIKKIRWFTFDGYVECEIEADGQQFVKDALKLIQ